MNILIIEDDPDISANLIEYLEAKHHQLDVARDGISGFNLASSANYDVIVLDLGLPGMDGLELSRRLRQEARKSTPVLMLTARDTLEDKLAGFEQGADDYLLKPFALKELEARLLALGRRQSGHTANALLQIADVEFDLETLVVRRDGRQLRLPRKCILLLEKLMRSPGKVITQAELEEHAWGEILENSDTLRTHMRTLRKELNAGGKRDLIENVRGIGYKMVSPDDN